MPSAHGLNGFPETTVAAVVLEPTEVDWRDTDSDTWTSEQWNSHARTCGRSRGSRVVDELTCTISHGELHLDTSSHKTSGVKLGRSKGAFQTEWFKNLSKGMRLAEGIPRVWPEQPQN